MYFDRDQTADILSNVAGLVQTYMCINFHLIQPHFNICRQCWHSKGQKVSICWVNKFISFFGETFNRNHSLGQFGLDFLFRNTIQVDVPVKQMPLLLFSPVWTFPITEVFANSFKSSKDVEGCFFVISIKRAPYLSF